MKNSLLLLSALLLASATQAQITLTSGSYPATVTGTDSLKVTAAASTFPSLAAAANGSWDLSTVTDSTPVLYAYRVPTTTYQFADSNFYALSTYNYQGNVQSSIMSSGLLEYGVDVQQVGYSLAAVTFTPTDSLTIPAQSTLYSSPRIKIAFPATYNTTWTSTYNFDFNYVLTVAAATLDHAAGVVRTYSVEKDSVKGWGKMRVKDLTGAASSWFDVLQVQTATTNVDSFFVSGAPASSTLLTALGVTQGQTTNTYEQNYYRPEEVTAFANVQYTDSTFTTPTQAKTHTQRLISTGVTNIANNQGVQVYPNPVTGGVVSIDVPATGGNWTYELIDVSGKKVATGALTVNGTHTQLSVPATATAGIYFIKLSNNGKQVCIKSVDIVK